MSTSLSQDAHFLVLDLTSNDTLSRVFVQEAFPYAQDDRLVILSYSLSLAVIRLGQKRLTPEQRELLHTTLAIVGFSLKPQSEMLALLAPHDQ